MFISQKQINLGKKSRISFFFLNILACLQGEVEDMFSFLLTTQWLFRSRVGMFKTKCFKRALNRGETFWTFVSNEFFFKPYLKHVNFIFIFWKNHIIFKSTKGFVFTSKTYAICPEWKLVSKAYKWRHEVRCFDFILYRLTTRSGKY